MRQSTVTACIPPFALSSQSLALQPAIEKACMPRRPAKDRTATTRTSGKRAKPKRAKPKRAEPSRRSVYGRRTAKKRPARKSMLGRVVGLLPTLLVVGMVSWAAAFYVVGPELPDTASLVQQSRQARVVVLDNNGEIVAERGVDGRPYVKLDEISDYVEEAVLATEDRRFYHHFGLDIFGTARAAIANLSAGGVVAGGSTITQQLAKNLYLTPERTIVRKLQELILAVWLEARMTKDEIFEVYLNRVYLGAGTYGVEAAAQLYFAKPAADLTLAESAMIAGLLKAPSRYAPTRDLKAAQDRAATVLRLMADVGHIDIATASQLPPARLAERLEQGRADAYVDYVLDEITEHLGKPDRTLVVRTTLDPPLQAAMETAVERRMKDHPGIQAAAVLLGADGSLKAMMGGRSRVGDHRNRAADIRRQPGSSFKPFVFAAAMEEGLTATTPITDEPFSVDGWTPRNAGGQFFGRITLQDAFARSLNSVAVKLSETVGRRDVVAQAKSQGIASPLKVVPSLALGTSEVTPLELAGAYQPFAAGGVKRPSFAVRKISDRDGKALYDHRALEVRVLSERAAGEMAKLLRAAVDTGSGRRAALSDRIVSGKTGTTQNNRDAWFVGYSGDLILAVWVGRDDQRGMEGISGANLPAQIFGDILRTTAPTAPLPIVRPDTAGPGSPAVASGPRREDGLKRFMDWLDGLLSG